MPAVQVPLQQSAPAAHGPPICWQHLPPWHVPQQVLESVQAAPFCAQHSPTALQASPAQQSASARQYQETGPQHLP